MERRMNMKKLVGTVTREKEIFIKGKTWFYQKFYSGNGTLEAVTLYDGVSGDFIKEFHTFEEMTEYIKNG